MATNESENENFCNSLTKNHITWAEKVLVEDKVLIQFKLDSRSDINIISLKTSHKIVRTVVKNIKLYNKYIHVDATEGLILKW